MIINLIVRLVKYQNIFIENLEELKNLAFCQSLKQKKKHEKQKSRKKFFKTLTGFFTSNKL